MDPQKRAYLEQSTSFKTMAKISKVMDNYYVDPIAGFALPEVGDILTQFLSLPSLYFALVKLQSFPLTLAVAYNMTLDVLIGLFPVIGDVADVFFKSYSKNYRMIQGFMDDDPNVIEDVNSKAVMMGLMTLVLILAIYLLYSINQWWINGVVELFGYILG